MIRRKGIRSRRGREGNRKKYWIRNRSGGGINREEECDR